MEQDGSKKVLRMQQSSIATLQWFIIVLLDEYIQHLGGAWSRAAAPPHQRWFMHLMVSSPSGDALGTILPRGNISSWAWELLGITLEELESASE